MNPSALEPRSNLIRAISLGRSCHTLLQDQASRISAHLGFAPFEETVPRNRAVHPVILLTGNTEHTWNSQEGSTSNGAIAFEVPSLGCQRRPKDAFAPITNLTDCTAAIVQDLTSALRYE